MRLGFFTAIAMLVSIGGPALSQIALDKHYDCEAAWAVNCGADAAACEKQESIIAERGFSVDLKRRRMRAALYSAIFSGPATIRVSKELITATGLLTSEYDPSNGKIFAVMTLRRGDAQFSVTWRGESDIGMVFAVGKCTAQTR